MWRGAKMIRTWTGHVGSVLKVNFKLHYWIYDAHFSADTWNVYIACVMCCHRNAATAHQTRPEDDWNPGRKDWDQSAEIWPGESRGIVYKKLLMDPSEMVNIWQQFRGYSIILKDPGRKSWKRGNNWSFSGRTWSIYSLLSSNLTGLRGATDSDDAGMSMRFLRFSKLWGEKKHVIIKSHVYFIH